MKAIVTTNYGPPELQQLKEIPQPVPKKGQVLLKVHATTVNRTDTGLRSANYFISRFFTGLLRPRFETFGSEFAGEVIELGEEVEDFSVGDKVFGFDDIHSGAHAEYMVTKAAGAITHIPEGLSYLEAAPLAEGAQYALNNIRAAGVKEGQKVLIYGASGAIGSAAVQICKYLGAEVTAVCGTKHTDLIISLKPDEIVDYQREDFTKTSERYHFIFDAVGKSTYGVCKKLLLPGGSYSSTELGPRGENVYLAIWFSLIGRKSVLFPIPQATKEKVGYLKMLVEQGAYRPLVDRTYSLEDIVEATKYVESGQKVGNVVVNVSYQPE
jgi:NADPH:quinone reductase-like Zn-dependent oxidoreductase